MLKHIIPLLLILCLPVVGADKAKPLPKDFKSLKALRDFHEEDVRSRLE